MSSMITQIAQGGRVVIPAELRQKMGLKVGDQVLLSWSEETQELRISTRRQRLQQARALVKRYASTGVVNDFIAERRQAAADE